MAAVYQEIGSGNKGCFFARQETDHAGYFRCFAHPRKRDAVDELSFQLVVEPDFMHDLGSDWTRAHCIYSYLPGASSSAAILVTALSAALLAAYTEALCGEIVADVDESMITEAPLRRMGMNLPRVK